MGIRNGSIYETRIKAAIWTAQITNLLGICSDADIFDVYVNADSGIYNFGDVYKGLVCGVVSFNSKIGVKYEF
tara:strand:- start:544 stop:762 length:219 start_codon:yes stop_codon:yes gene_type:complete